MNSIQNLYRKARNRSLMALVLFLCFFANQMATAQIAYVANSTGRNVTAVNLATGATRTVIKTIDINGAPLKIVGSPDGTNQRLAVISSDAISFLLLEQDSIVHFTAGIDLRDVLYSSDGLNLYTIDKSSNVIKPYDATTFTTINYSVPSSGDAPQAATFDPNTGNLVVINNGSNNLSFFSVAPDPDTPNILRIAQVLDNIAVGQSPQDIVYLPDGRAYVSNFGSNNITIINTDGTTNTIGGLNQPTAMIVSPDGAFVYAINQGSNSVAVLDANTNSIVKTIMVGTMPRDLATTLDGAFVVVVNQGNNSLSVIDASVNNVIRTISNVGNGPVSVAILDPFVFADFRVEIPPGDAPIKARFNASASRASLGIAKYEFFFGDGFSAIGDTLSRVYNQNGIYTAVLLVTDSSEVNSASKVVEFSIPQNDPPIARIQVNSLDIATRTVVLNAFESSDSDGNIVSYTWNFGDNTPDTTTTTPTVTHTYRADAGLNFTISLIVEDNNRAKGQAETTISFNRLPVALFTINPTVVGIDSLTVTLDAAASSDPEGSSLTYSWDFGDGSDLGEGVSTTHTYTSLGTFPIVLTVTDELGGANIATKEVTVHKRPEAILAVNPVTGSAPLAVNFDASASTDDGSIAIYTWDFGDGSASNGVTTSHIYTTVGNYIAVLTVTDNLGATDTATVTITVLANPAPIANLTAVPTSGSAPLTVNFDAGTSTDDGSIVSYSWDFGDGSVGNGVTTSNTYNTIGDFTVVLTVTDNLGATDTATVKITVSANPAPVARITTDQTSGSTPLTVNFDAGTSTDDGSIVSYSWDFGDGSVGSGVTTSHTYNTVGDFTVVLTVTDNLGATDTASVQVKVINIPPIAKMKANPTTGTIPFTVNFDGSESSDLDGEIVSYVWDFGDGTGDSGVITTHTYTTFGNFIAVLTVTDNLGATDRDTVQIGAPNPPVAKFSYTIDPLIINLDATESRDLDGEIVNYAWDFGDGSTATGLIVSHTYSTAGDYLITLVVTDNDGLTGVDSQIVTIPTEPPIAMFTLIKDSLTVTVDASESSDLDGSIVNYAWDFGDGNTASGISSSHSYTSEGTYVITLVVTDNDGTTDQISKEVTVPSEPPVAVIDANANALVVNVDASNSFDSDGAIVSYAWDFGDGTTGSDVTAVHTYALAGTYTISLTVTDNQGLTATASTLVIAEDSQCNLTTGALQIIGPDVTCISSEPLTVALRFTKSPKAPKKYQVAFVISQGKDMKIVQVAKQKALTINAPGLYRIHTLVYNSATLDLDNLILLDQTTIAELNELLVPGGGISCAALDMNGIVLVVNDCLAGNDIIAYPNPTTESLTITLPALKGVQQIAIELFHINGILAKKWILDGYSTQTNLNLNSLDQGLYHMRILYDQQLIQEMTIVKVR